MRARRRHGVNKMDTAENSITEVEVKTGKMERGGLGEG